MSLAQRCETPLYTVCSDVQGWRLFRSCFPLGEGKNGKALRRTFEGIVKEVAADMGFTHRTFFVAKHIIALAEQSCMFTACTAALDFRYRGMFFHSLTSMGILYHMFCRKAIDLSNFLLFSAFGQ